MKPLLKNIRFYILCASFVVSLVIYFFVTITVNGPAYKLTLAQVYALTAVVYLYSALFVGPLSRIFPRFPFISNYLKARRALGVSVFYFALLHVRYTFFDILGGFPGVLALNARYTTAVVLGSLALFILFLMAATSFDYMVRKLTFRKWKMLHRFVYIASIFTIIHAILIGSHFQKFGLIPSIFSLALVVLLMLEAIAFVKMRRSTMQ